MSETMSETINTELTIKDMADLFKEPPKRIEYLISKYRIKESRRIGQARIFDEQGQTQIKEALYGIQIRKNREQGS